MITFGCCQNIKCSKRQTPGQTEVCRRFTLARDVSSAEELRCTCGCRQTSHLACAYEVSGSEGVAPHASSKAAPRISSAERARGTTTSSTGGAAQFIFGNMKGNPIASLHVKATETSKFGFGVSRDSRNAVEMEESANSSDTEVDKKKEKKLGKKRSHSKSDKSDHARSVSTKKARKSATIDSDNADLLPSRAGKSIHTSTSTLFGFAPAVTPSATIAAKAASSSNYYPSDAVVTDLCADDEDDNTAAAPFAASFTRGGAASSNTTASAAASSSANIRIAEPTNTDNASIAIAKINAIEDTLKNVCTMVVSYYEQMRDSNRLMRELQERTTNHHTQIIHELSRITSFLDMEDMTQERFEDNYDDQEEYP